MKIVDKEQFNQLPAGTIYSEFEPCIFKGLLIKGDQLECDYVEMSLIGNIKAGSSSELFDLVEDSVATGKSLELDFDFYGRNGLFDDDQMYAIYEKQDIEQFINILKSAIDGKESIV